LATGGPKDFITMSTLPSATLEAAATPTSFEALLGPWANSADPAYCRDSAGHLLAVNQAFARKFGRAAAEWAGTPLRAILHADDGAALTGIFAELERPPYRAVREHRCDTPQGWRWLAWEKTPLRDGTGRIYGLRAVGRDITKQRLAEEQYLKLSRAVEQSPVAMVITDAEGRVQYVNPKYTEASGRTLEDILDGNIDVLRDGHPDEASYHAMLHAVREHREWRGELMMQRPDGRSAWEAVKVSSLRGPGGDATNLLCLREDITERKRLEQELRQSQKMESLGTLAGGIAHDFNNLLAIINGYAEFCLNHNTDPAQAKKSLQEIHRAAQRASGLVRQILTFSRKNEVRYAPFDLNQQVKELVALLAETFPRTVAFDVRMAEKLPPLLADQNQIQQILLNLCVNARDAMPAGGTITVRTLMRPGVELAGTTGVDAGKMYACLEVADTGTGMTPEVRARLFEPFFTTKPGTQGTGLGLAVVYGIVTSHKGFIDVQSTLGAGSTFIVGLPFADEAVVVPALVSGGEFPGGTETILVVDDEVSLRRLLETAFTAKGYRVITAANGLEAIDYLSRTDRPLDAVLLDLNMPGANGVDVFKVVRLARPGTKVIILSGQLHGAARAELQAIGQTDFLQKPYALDEVGRRLRTLLDKR
jgi:two-component system, cell cycle sensor histidine kinase and response regulator CckA